MTTPDFDEPKREVERGARGLRAIGFASAGFGLLIVLAFGYFNRYARFQRHFIAAGLIAWFIPGVLFVLFAHFLRRGRRAAAIGAMITVSIQLLIALAALASNFLLTPISFAPVLLCLLWVIALASLLLPLSRSLRAIRIDAENRRGFDLAGDVPRPVIPVDPTDSDSSEPR